MRIASSLKNQHRTVPPTQPLTPEQVKNSAGGYVYSTNMWQQLERFLILGTDGGTYYINETKLITTNLDVVRNCWRADAKRTAETIVKISNEGRAMKNDFAIAALAVGSTLTGEIASLAYNSVPSVCRIFTHLTSFLEMRAALGVKPSGSGLKKCLCRWLTKNQNTESVMRAALKYKNRQGWTWRDVLRVAHPKVVGDMNTFFKWVISDKWEGEQVPKILEGYQLAQKATEQSLPAIITNYSLEREMVPNTLFSKGAWTALLQNLGYTAVLRNLNNMSMYPDFDFNAIVAKLQDKELLSKGKVHPLSIFVSRMQYAAGKGNYSDRTWKPSQKVIDALDDAYENAFSFIEPTGKKIAIAVDCSGSMSASAGTNISCSQASGGIALTYCRFEPNTSFIKFGTASQDVTLSKRMSLADAFKTFHPHMGGTDLAAPVRHLLANKTQVDVLVILTDNETWAGHRHTSSVWKDYLSMYPNAKLVIASTCSNKFTAGDPNDPSVLQIVGFDASIMDLIREFISQ